MRRIITLMAVLGVFTYFSACTDEISAPSEEATAKQESSSKKEDSKKEDSKKENSKKEDSSNKKDSKDDAPEDSTVIKDSVTVKKDTIREKVYIIDSATVEDPYYSSGVPFCWSDECRENYSAGAEEPTSSSSEDDDEGAASMEVPSENPPIIKGDKMTDVRDSQTYALQTIAGKLWMAENLRFKSPNGLFCKVNGGDDMCEKYGSYYSRPVALKVCPGGWRLPTEEEIQAADAEVDEEWWILAGRFKYNSETGEPTDYGLENQQSYYWISSNDHSSWRVQPDSKEHVLQSKDAGNGRAYNVRCVQDDSAKE